MNERIVGPHHHHYARSMRKCATAVASVLLVAVTAGCAEVHSVRAVERSEQDVVDSALRPLLRELGYFGNPKPACAVPVFVDDVRTNFLKLTPGMPASACGGLGLHVTAETIRTLPPQELRAILAHELAHLQLGHVTTMERRALIQTRNMVTISLATPAFTAEQEMQADRFAASLLTAVSGSSGKSDCHGVRDLIDRVRRERRAWSTWEDLHPIGNGRGEHARRLCDLNTGS